jgi:hypothetical protein
VPFNKAEKRRQLLPLLNNRPPGAVERKHQNISAILIELEFTYIDGYKPLPNYQNLLFDVVEERLRQRPQLITSVAAEVARPVAVPSVDDIPSRLVDRPEPLQRSPARRLRERRVGSSVAVDYIQLEAQNHELGRAGELFVLNFERARLLAGRADALAQRVEHVAVTRGDHLGFDILSFHPNGRERIIEVKTTRFGAYTPFYITRNELATSESRAVDYTLVRLFVSGHRGCLKFRVVKQTCDLEPSQFVARIA